jgi:hypothetical protein
MVLHSHGHGVTEKRLWCYRVTVMVLQSNGYGTGGQSTHGFLVKGQRGSHTKNAYIHTYTYICTHTHTHTHIYTHIYKYSHIDVNIHT